MIIRLYVTVILMLILSKVSAGPLEVAQNVFQEYKQVQELIKQVEEIIKQIEQQAEIVKNLSGKNIYQMTSQEIELLRWLPIGENLLDPINNSAYTQHFREIEEQLSLLDPFELLNVVDDEDDTRSFTTQAKSRLNLQKTTIANAAYSRSFMDQFDERVDVVSGYLTKLNTSETLKTSVDINIQITGQAVINQIEINRTMAMMLKQKTAEAQAALSNERYNTLFITGEKE